MFDQVKVQEIRTMMAGGSSPKPSLASLTESELRRLRSDVDALLPRGGLDGLNLEQELVDQFYAVKGLQEEVLGDPDIAANQRAQTCNAVASTLQKLIDMQVDMQRDEQLKRMETALIEALNTLPDETKALFFVEYERIAAAADAFGR